MDKYYIYRAFLNNGNWGGATDRYFYAKSKEEVYDFCEENYPNFDIYVEKLDTFDKIVKELMAKPIGEAISTEFKGYYSNGEIYFIKDAE